MPDSGLAKKHCVPCEGGVPPLDPAVANVFLQELPGWRMVNHHHLEKVFVFKDFQSALDWVNKLGAVAEEEGHHPEIRLSWGRVEVLLWTHAIDGLTENDFIVAAKADAL